MGTISKIELLLEERWVAIARWTAFIVGLLGIFSFKIAEGISILFIAAAFFQAQKKRPFATRGCALAATFAAFSSLYLSQDWPAALAMLCIAIALTLLTWKETPAFMQWTGFFAGLTIGLGLIDQIVLLRLALSISGGVLFARTLLVLHLSPGQEHRIRPLLITILLFCAWLASWSELHTSLATSWTATDKMLLLGFGVLACFLVGIAMQTLAWLNLEREMLKAEVAALNDKLNMVLESGSISVWGANLKDETTWASPQQEQILGYEKRPEDWSVASLYKLVHPDDVRMVIKNHTEAITGASEGKSSFRIIRADNQEVRWLTFYTRPVKNNEDELIGLTGTMIDDTVAKNKEAEIERLKEWRRAILSATPMVFIGINATGIIQTVGKGAEALLGYDEKDLMGKEFAKLFDPATLAIKARSLTRELGFQVEPTFDALIAKARSRRRSEESEEHFISKNGSKVAVKLNVSPLIDSSGNIYGYLTIAHDVREFWRSQEELRALFNLHERVVEASGVGIAELEYEGDRRLRLDARARKIFGYTSDEPIRSTSFIKLIHPEDWVMINQGIEQHVKDKSKRFRFDFRITKASGSSRWVRATGEVIFIDGKRDRIIACVQDQTERFNIKSELEKALLAIETAASGKAAFLADMSVELLTPINGLIGMVDQMNKSDLSPNKSTLASKIHEEASYIQSLIQDILDFSKIEGDHFTLEDSPLDLTTIVENQADLLLNKAKEKGVTLSTFISPSLPTFILSDGKHLKRILNILISNAVKKTPTGGVTIRALGKTASQVNKVGKVIRFEIEDSGLGLTKENLAGLFRSLDQTRATAASISLAICQGVVDAMGGSIGAEASKQGSIFWFEIPLRENDSTKTKQKPDSNIATLQGKKILLIEDDPFAAKVLLAYLSAWRSAGDITASSGQATSMILEAARRGQPYDVITIATPRSLEIFRDLKASINEPFGTVLFILSQNSGIDEQQIKTQGIDFILRKPIKRAELAAELARASQQSSIRKAS